MKEVKTPKKPLLYYYSIAILVVLLFNFLVMPLIVRQQVEESDRLRSFVHNFTQIGG